MSFIGILFSNILLMFILGSTLIAFVFFIISMILFSKTKKSESGKKKNMKKTSAIITFVINAKWRHYRRTRRRLTARRDKKHSKEQNPYWNLSKFYLIL